MGITVVDVVGRRAVALGEMADVATELGIEVNGVLWRDGCAVLDRPIVISTVPRGVADDFARLVDESRGAPAIGRGVLLDVVYSPWPTNLAVAWQVAGGTVVSGLHMLVGQAGRQVQLMTGRQAPLGQMLDAGLASLGNAC
jgi:shikimate dehydrogenase